MSKLTDILWPWGALAEIKRVVTWKHEALVRGWDALQKAREDLRNSIKINDGLREQLSRRTSELSSSQNRVNELEALIAKFDHDGNGKPGGGSRKKVKP